MLMPTVWSSKTLYKISLCLPNIVYLDYKSFGEDDLDFISISFQSLKTFKFKLHYGYMISNQTEYFLGKLHVCKIYQDCYQHPRISSAIKVLCSLVNIRELTLSYLTLGFQEYQILASLSYLEKLQLRSITFTDNDDDKSKLKLQQFLYLKIDCCRKENHENEYELYDYIFYGLDKLQILVVIDNNINLQTQALIVQCSQLQTIIFERVYVSFIYFPSLLSRLPNFACSDDLAIDGEIFTRMNLIEKYDLLFPYASESFWNSAHAFQKKTLK